MTNCEGGETEALPLGERAGRKQRADLGGIAGVVQDRKQPAPRGQRAEQGVGLIEVARDLGRVDVEGAEQAADGVQWVQGTIWAG